MISLRTKLGLFIALPLAFQMLFSVVIGILLERSELMAEYENRSKEVIGRANWSEFLAASVALCWTGYKLTARPEYREVLQSVKHKLSEENERMTALYAANETQSDEARQLLSINHRLDERLTVLDSQKELSRPDQVKALFSGNELLPLWNEAITLRQKLLASERGRFKANFEDVVPQRKLIRVLMYAGLAFYVLLALLSTLTYGGTVGRRIKALIDNANRLSRGEALNPAIVGNDEVALLDDTFHAMANAINEAAEKERAIIRNAVDVICSIDADGNFISVNPAADDLFGIPHEELKSRSLLDLTDPESLNDAKDSLTRARSTDKAFSVELAMRSTDARRVETLWSMRWVPKESSIFCVVHDLTERKQVERLKQEVLSMVSHDIRSPLTTIQGAVEFLLKSNDSSQSQQSQHLLTLAKNNCQRILTLSMDILDFDKLESGMLEIRKEKVPVLEVFDAVLETMQTIAEKKNVHLSLSGASATVFADRERLVQIIANLVSNAIKFSPNGGTVSLGAEESYSYVELTVADQGRGVPANMTAVIFDRFRQIERGDMTERRGTGLGLAICKQLVELHGGTIACSSEPGKGSLFTVRLPKGE